VSHANVRHGSSLRTAVATAEPSVA
jgi:hypothetical protein